MTPRALTLTPKLRGARVQLHARLLAQVAAHQDQVPCTVQPDGLDWLDPRDEQQHQAAKLCAECPALAACHAYIAGRPSEPGAWAGTTEREREQRAATARATQQARRERAATA